MNENPGISRRDFLKIAGIMAGGAFLAACGVESKSSPEHDPYPTLLNNSNQIEVNISLQDGSVLTVGGAGFYVKLSEKFTGIITANHLVTLPPHAKYVSSIGVTQYQFSQELTRFDTIDVPEPSFSLSPKHPTCQLIHHPNPDVDLCLIVIPSQKSYPSFNPLPEKQYPSSMSVDLSGRKGSPTPNDFARSAMYLQNIPVKYYPENSPNTQLVFQEPREQTIHGSSGSPVGNADYIIGFVHGGTGQNSYDYLVPAYHANELIRLAPAS